MADAKKARKTVKVIGKGGEVRQTARKAPKTQSVVDTQSRVSVHRAKILDAAQFRDALQFTSYNEKRESLYHLRMEVILRLSFEAGLRAREISGLRWNLNVLDSAGKIGGSLLVTRNIGKRSSERTIPLTKTLRKALLDLYAVTPNDEFVVYRLDTPDFGAVRPNTLVQFLKRYYRDIGFDGCTSHSGRRTFITRLARTANLRGGSLVDVQQLAGHRQLQTTSLYIEPSSQQREMVTNVFTGA